MFYSTVKSRFTPILEIRKNAQIGKFLFFVILPTSHFLSLFIRFLFLMTLLDQRYQKTKKFGFLEPKKIPQSDVLPRIRRFCDVMTLRDQGYQKKKKIGFLELKKILEFFKGL